MADGMRLELERARVGTVAETLGSARTALSQILRGNRGHHRATLTTAALDEIRALATAESECLARPEARTRRRARLPAPRLPRGPPREQGVRWACWGERPGRCDRRGGRSRALALLRAAPPARVCVAVARGDWGVEKSTG